MCRVLRVCPSLAWFYRIKPTVVYPKYCYNGWTASCGSSYAFVREESYRRPHRAWFLVQRTLRVIPQEILTSVSRSIIRTHQALIACRRARSSRQSNVSTNCSGVTTATTRSICLRIRETIPNTSAILKFTNKPRILSTSPDDFRALLMARPPSGCRISAARNRYGIASVPSRNEHRIRISIPERLFIWD
jgi:hypothetical protein